MSIDVLIIGGGPTGLMMAALLKRQGIHSRIVDNGTDQARESRALGIQAKTMELFQNMGIVDSFKQKGHIASGGRVFLNGKERISLDFSDMGRKDTPYPYIFFLSQEETEKNLIEDLNSLGIKVERQTSLVSFSQTESLVTAVLENAKGEQEIVTAKYLVGCDGSHSVVRHGLGLTFEGAAYESDFIMADAKVSWPYGHDKLMIFLDPGNVGVHFPIHNEKLSRVLTIRDPETDIPETTETTSFPATLEEVEANFQKAAHVSVKLTDPKWVTRFKVHHRCVNKMRVGRIFVAGDAAHIHSPAGAQGMNTGLQDAANLAWKLAAVLQKNADITILETYESERLPIARHILNFTDRFFGLMTTHNKIFIAARNIVMPVIAKFLMSNLKGRQVLFSFISQLGIRYHESAVVAFGAGKRMPNEKLKNGQEFFDLLKGYDFHLLIFGESERYMDLPQIQIHQMAASQFMATGIILVRPDGYIAFQASKINERTFEEMKSHFHYLWKTDKG